ncbi:hypothetical protein L7F22_000959 [Adiantum nelumboides]|nr:hypothetical protein [Adiantum nelumboides]
MDKEIVALDVNQTWELVPLPEGKKAIGCKWVYKVKHNTDGTIERYKARVVAKGYAQTYGIDYEDTFALVAKMVTVRTVIAVAAAKRWFMHQMDVKNAFLQGELQEEVYVEKPLGYEDGKQDYVCQLHKALYGLKQAPRAWHDRIIEYLLRIGFCMSHADHSHYVRQSDARFALIGFCMSHADHSLYVCQSDARFVLITIYVDDLIIVGDSEIEIEHVKGLLKKDFEMKDLGELRYFFGLEDCGQSHLLDYHAARFELYSGTLEFMQLSQKPHLDGVCCTLHYVRASLDHALFYAADVPMELHGYTDADWASSATDQWSTSSFMFTLGSVAITWSSKKQPTIALSSTEAEYRGAAVATCEVAWFMQATYGFEAAGGQRDWHLL